MRSKEYTSGGQNEPCYQHEDAVGSDEDSLDAVKVSRMFNSRVLHHVDPVFRYKWIWSTADRVRGEPSSSWFVIAPTKQDVVSMIQIQVMGVIRTSDGASKSGGNGI